MRIEKIRRSPEKKDIITSQIVSLIKEGKRMDEFFEKKDDTYSRLHLLCGYEDTRQAKLSLEASDETFYFLLGDLKSTDWNPVIYAILYER